MCVIIHTYVKYIVFSVLYLNINELTIIWNTSLENSFFYVGRDIEVEI